MRKWFLSPSFQPVGKGNNATILASSILPPLNVCPAKAQCLPLLFALLCDLQGERKPCTKPSWCISFSSCLGGAVSKQHSWNVGGRVWGDKDIWARGRNSTQEKDGGVFARKFLHRAEGKQRQRGIVLHSRILT